MRLTSLVIPLMLTLALHETASADQTSETVPVAAAHGLDGMAPAGHWATRLTVLRNGYDQHFDNAHDKVDLDQANNAMLAGFGINAQVDSKITTEYTELMLGYGVTENLTLGAIIPYARTTNRVRLTDTAPGGVAILQGALAGLGYQPLQTTAIAGFGDPTLGALWRFDKGPHDSTVLGLGVRLGVAKADNPDNLADLPPGDGSNDLRLRLEHFRDLGKGFDLRLMAEYQRQFADHVTLRPGNPLTTPTKEVLKRDLGDYWEYDVELGKIFGDWRYSATWHRFQKAPDRYTSSIGTDTSFLSAGTNPLTDQLRLGITWSGIRAWQAGKLPMPLIVKLEMQDAVQGRNFVAVKDVYLRITSFF